MIRFIDIAASLIGLLLTAPLLVVLWFIVWVDVRAPLFRQERVGRYQKPFILIKFRTMRPGTASQATHLVEASAVTPVGRFLRRTKLDELPQLWNVLSGDMSIVGPRPCLFNQRDLIAQREALGVFRVRPGITGLAQVQGIDMSTPELLAKTDFEMLQRLNISYYLQCVGRTLLGNGAGDRLRRDS